MIWTYLLLAYLFSGLGFLVYRLFIRQKGSSAQRKTFILGVLIISLVFPTLFLSKAPEQDRAVEERLTLLREELFMQPEEPELMACYNQALREEEFCKCDELSQQSIIRYREITFFDTCMTCEQVIPPIWMAITAALLLMLLLQIGNLARIILRAERSTITIDGQSYVLLRYDGPFLAASFRLFRSYLIWQPALDALPEAEQQAIMYHEIGHLKHFDTWLQVGLSLMQVLWMVNPIFYLFRKEINTLNEFLADSFAIQKTQDPYAYAMLLVQMKERQSQGLIQFYAGNPLKHRVERILDPEPKVRYFLPILLMTGLSIFGIGQLADQEIDRVQANLKYYHEAKDLLEQKQRNYFCGSCLIDHNTGLNQAVID
ncbi:MAG: M56 family metallopeptidase [Bacteroidota bacterium]